MNHSFHPSAIFICIISLFLTVSHSIASPDILPGLWKFNVSVKSESGHVESAINQAIIAFESLPPEQKALMNQVMKKTGIERLNLQNQTFERCITQAEIENFSLPNPKESCTQNLQQTAPDRYALTMSCKNNPPMKGTGELRILNNKQMLGQVALETEFTGKAENMQFIQQANWITGDCH